MDWEGFLQARQNATVRYLLNFHQDYPQNFSPVMIEVLRNVPRQRRTGRTSHNTHKKRLNHKTPDYLELNRRRPSVIRRSIQSGAKCSSPREAILEPQFDYDMKTHDQEISPINHVYPQAHDRLIHKDPQLSASLPNYPQHDPTVIPTDFQGKQPVEQISDVTQNTTSLTEKKSRHSHFVPPFTTKHSLVSNCLEHHKSPIIQKNHTSDLDSKNVHPKVPSCPVIDSIDSKAKIALHAEQPVMKDKKDFSILSKTSNTTFTENFKNTKQHLKPYLGLYEYTADTKTSKESCNKLKQFEGQEKKKRPLESHSNEEIVDIIEPSNKSRPVKHQADDPQPSKNDKEKFCCIHCNKRFRWFSHWQAHERIHTGVRPYKCTQCDRSFTRGDGLQAHMVIHSTKKPYKCSICVKVFARKSMLERHVVDHTGILPYICDVCHEELLDPEMIEGHVAKHVKQSKFKCPYCKKCFANGKKLVRHIRAHTGKIGHFQALVASL